MAQGVERQAAFENGPGTQLRLAIKHGRQRQGRLVPLAAEHNIALVKDAKPSPRRNRARRVIDDGLGNERNCNPSRRNPASEIDVLHVREGKVLVEPAQ